MTSRTGLLHAAAYATAVALAALVCLAPSVEGKLTALPLPYELKDCYLRAQNYSVENYVGGLYCWYCETPVRAYVKGAPTPLKPPQYSYYRQLYSKIEPRLHSAHNARAHGHVHKRQATLPARCLRKEYRMMTDAERNAFHVALNTLKRDTSVEPNKFDALALFHTGVATFVAHGGAGFPAWHRVYLLLMEAALQEVDPSVCLPYWDSTMDAAMTVPAESYVWSADFFGSPQGDVTEGPLAGWVTPEGLPVRRAVGGDGMPFTRQVLETLMSRPTHEEIFMPNRDPQYSLEMYHGSTHVFVGGDMESLDTAAFDIVFFLHHAFVDYIWELFREKMRNEGYNPEAYPVGEHSDYHLPTAFMGFGNITHEEGYLDALTDSYEYQPTPQCSPRNTDCGSKYLWCNTTINMCVPINPAFPPVPTPGPHPEPCKGHNKPQAYQNSFCINGVCDVNQWVWLPVKIVAQRPPEFTDYKSYPVTKGQIRKTSDIYEPSMYSDTRRYIGKKTAPKGYENCKIDDGIGRIYVSSMGVDYDGAYKESAIIDQRLATSVSITYIAVKDPGTRGKSEVILRAHDQCGRVCHTACKVPFSNPPRYEACSGVVKVTPEFPRQYGQTYASATLDVYDYAGNSDCPNVKTDDFFVTFYCDYRDHLPWVDKPAGGFPAPVQPPPPVSPPHSPAGRCKLSTECTIDKACEGFRHNRQCSVDMEAHECLGNCGRYAICVYGVYWPRKCRDGERYDERKGKCVFGGCSANMGAAHGPTHGFEHVHQGSGSLGAGTRLSSWRGSSTRVPSLRPGSTNLDANTNRYYSRLMSRFGGFSVGKK